MLVFFSAVFAHLTRRLIDSAELPGGPDARQARERLESDAIPLAADHLEGLKSLGRQLLGVEWDLT